MPDCSLVLEDGTTFSGSSFGAERPVEGEVVFNTAMTGYVETLTDPSYRGQILVCTYPLVGNYGVPDPRDPRFERSFESGNIQVEGLVVQNYVAGYSHHSATRSLGDWLTAGNVPAITGIDTRSLTRRLREHGTMRGWLFPRDLGLIAARRTAQAVEMSRGVFQHVAPRRVSRLGAGGMRILLIDVGAKENIVRSLLCRDVALTRAPWHTDLTRFASHVDGIVIGNGPGDPSDLLQLVEQVRWYLHERPHIPVFGICLGNQILALAAGATTYKLAYGHRGVNQPVQDLTTRRCFITSQNHGYAVRDDALPDGWEPWFVNVHDGTNEGIRSTIGPWCGVQFHPEAHPGPEDTGFLFDDFLNQVQQAQSRHAG